MSFRRTASRTCHFDESPWATRRNLYPESIFKISPHRRAIDKIGARSHHDIAIKEVVQDPRLRQGKEPNEDPQTHKGKPLHIAPQIIAKGIGEIVEEDKYIDEFGHRVSRLFHKIHPHPIWVVGDRVQNADVEDRGEHHAVPKGPFRKHHGLSFGIRKQRKQRAKEE